MSDESTKEESQSQKTKKRNPVLKLTKIAVDVPDPVQIKPGLVEVKLFAGNKDRFLMQNDRREFSTRLNVKIPSGYAISVWPGENLNDAVQVDPGRPKDTKTIGVDVSTQFFSESQDELVIVLRNYGFGAYHPKDWEFSVYLQLTELPNVSMKVEVIDEIKAAQKAKDTATEPVSPELKGKVA